jgi:hypothetical protein
VTAPGSGSRQRACAPLPRLRGSSIARRTDNSKSLLLADLVNPGHPRTLYQVTAAYGLNNDRRQALDTLRPAVERGWDDAGEMSSGSCRWSLHPPSWSYGARDFAASFVTSGA